MNSYLSIIHIKGKQIDKSYLRSQLKLKELPSVKNYVFWRGQFFMDKDDLEKSRIKEWKKNPMINFADSVNRSMVGDPSALSKGGCLTRVLMPILIVIGLLILRRCSI